MYLALKNITGTELINVGDVVTKEQLGEGVDIQRLIKKGALELTDKPVGKVEKPNNKTEGNKK